jgi:FkbM family methyltransferase
VKTESDVIWDICETSNRGPYSGLIMAKWHERLFRWYVSGPDHPAKLRLVRWLSPWFIPEGGVLCDVAGARMWLHPEDDIEGQLYRGVAYEANTLEFIRRNLHAGETAVFAGANTGLHLITAALAVGESGTVVGVEPQPLSLHRMMRNIHSNPVHSKVHLVSGGLGEAQLLVPMGEAPPDHTGWASLVLRDPGRIPYQIQVLRYEMLAEHLALPRVKLMLLDVEGYELQALRGMSRANCPAILLVEVHNTVLSMTKTTPQQYFDAVVALGYETWNMDGRRASPNESIIDNNLVCVRYDVTVVHWLEKV